MALARVREQQHSITIGDIVRKLLFTSPGKAEVGKHSLLDGLIDDVTSVPLVVEIFTVAVIASAAIDGCPVTRTHVDGISVVSNTSYHRALDDIDLDCRDAGGYTTATEGRQLEGKRG